MLKKNFKLIVAAIILLGLCGYLIINYQKSTLKKELSDFAVKDTASIDKIFLADKSGNKILLERKPNFKWILNGKQDARIDVVNNLLKTVYKLQVNSPVGKDAFNNVVKTLASSGIKVELYSKGINVKTFYVGGLNQANTGTYMIIENSSTPFVVTMPGFEGYLTPCFPTHEYVWRGTSIFNYAYGEIAKVELYNFEQPQTSFTIEKQTSTGTKKINLLASNKPVANFDTAKVNAYLLQFKNLNYEGIADMVRPTRKDSAMQRPMFKLDVTVVDGQKKSITFYRKPVDKGMLNDAGIEVDYDVDRMFAIVDNNKTDLIVTQFFVFDKILKPVQYFLKK